MTFDRFVEGPSIRNATKINPTVLQLSDNAKTNPVVQLPRNRRAYGKRESGIECVFHFALRLLFEHRCDKLLQ
jgi:hypothetical protein